MSSKTNTVYKNNQTNDYNDVVIQGRITHIMSRPSLVVLTICTGRATKEMSYVRAVCYGDAMKQALSFKKDDRVRVTGNIQSSIRNTKIENQQTLSVFAESVSEPLTAFSERFEDASTVEGDFVESKNEFRVSGTVVNVAPSKSGNSLYLTVRSIKNGRLSFVKITYYPKDKENVEEIKRGTKVCSYGWIRAKNEKNESGKFLYKHYFIALEVHTA